MKPKTGLLINFFINSEIARKKGSLLKKVVYGANVGAGVALNNGIVLLVKVEFKMLFWILFINCIVGLSPLKVCVIVLTVYMTTKHDKTTVDVTNNRAATVDSKASPPPSSALYFI
jgi:hypothetical protein